MEFSIAFEWEKWGVSHLGWEGILYRWLPTRASSAELRMAQKLTDLSRAISWLSWIAGALDSVTTVLWRRNITLSSIIPICCWLSLHTIPVCLYVCFCSRPVQNGGSTAFDTQDQNGEHASLSISLSHGWDLLVLQNRQVMLLPLLSKSPNAFIDSHYKNTILFIVLIYNRTMLYRNRLCKVGWSSE